MRALVEMDTIQIEVTNACVRQCGNCTRLCGHEVKPYFMDEATFVQAVDSLVGAPNMVGVMGGEPLLHHQFDRFCELLRERIPRTRCGLWTTLPVKFKDKAETICETFGQIFINDHSRSDIFHAPVLAAAGDYFPNPRDLFLMVEHCWVQEHWSASINPKGAYFCEVAAALALLFNGPDGWPVEAEWWKRVPKDFREQQEWACAKCGCALPFNRRVSTDERDDVSPSNLIRLQEVKSRKVADQLYEISTGEFVEFPQQMATYKDLAWRQKIAARYGINLSVNKLGFNEPTLSRTPLNPDKPSLFEQIKQRYSG